jgi:hypothetical protein
MRDKETDGEARMAIDSELCTARASVLQVLGYAIGDW